MAKEAAKAGDAGAQKAGAAGPKIVWDDSNMRSSYANVCNVSSTREEVVLLFGINQNWHGGRDHVHVQLTDRVILSPFAAKRLQILLSTVMGEYESRFGPLSVEGQATDGRAPQ